MVIDPNGMTDAQILHHLDTERDRLRRYTDAAGGDPDGYRVREIAADVTALEIAAAGRGLA